MTLAEHGSNGEALTALAVSWRNAPPLAETAALMAARLRRKEARNDRVDIRDLSAVSPWHKRLDNLETGEGLQRSSFTFSRLAQGRLDEALALARVSNFESYLLRTRARFQLCLGHPPFMASLLLANHVRKVFFVFADGFD